MVRVPTVNWVFCYCVIYCVLCVWVCVCMCVVYVRVCMYVCVSDAHLCNHKPIPVHQ